MLVAFSVAPSGSGDSDGSVSEAVAAADDDFGDFSAPLAEGGADDDDDDGSESEDEGTGAEAEPLV